MKTNIQRKAGPAAAIEAANGFPAVLRRGDGATMRDALNAWLKARGLVHGRKSFAGKVKS